MNICAVPYCTSNSMDNPTLTFFDFPENQRRCIEWLSAIGRGHRSSQLMAPGKRHLLVICQRHFDPDELIYIGLRKTTLKPDVMPTKNIPTQSEQMKMREEFEKLLDHFLHKNTARVIKSQLALMHSKDSCKFAHSFRLFCLKLCLAWPKHYAALQSTLQLRNTRSLREDFLMSVITDRSIYLNLLNDKITNMKDLNKNCTVLISKVDLMPHIFYHVKEDAFYGFCQINGIKSPEAARYAIVVTVRGLYSQWLLPVDYALFSTLDKSIVALWVESVITKLLSSGLYVRVCISDLEPTFLTRSIKHQVGPERPIFEVSESQIYYVYNPSSLMVNFMIVFMVYELRIDDTVAKWQDIVTFYNIDCKREHRLVPELTEEHVSPKHLNKIDKGIVKTVVSYRVAAAMSAHIDFGQMPESAKGTVKLLMIMIKVFDFINGDTGKIKKSSADANTMINLASEALTLLGPLKIFHKGQDVTHTYDILDKLRISIKAELNLLQNMQWERLPCFSTKYIKADIINIHINKVRKASKKGHIIPWKLISMFRKLQTRSISLVKNMYDTPEDVAKMLYKYLKSELEPIPFNTNIHVSRLPMLVRKSEYTEFKLDTSYQVLQVSIFLMEKSWETHTNCVLPQQETTPDVKDYSRYIKVFGSSRPPQDYKRVPCDRMLEFVEFMDTNLKKTILNTCTMSNQLQKIVIEALQKIKFDTKLVPCRCFPSNYFITLFYRLRISLILKENYRKFKNAFNTTNHLKLTFTQLK